MLPHDLPLILSPKAEDNFADILQYTILLEAIMAKVPKREPLPGDEL